MGGAGLGIIDLFDEVFYFYWGPEVSRRKEDAVSVLNRAVMLAKMFDFYHSNKDYFTDITLINYYFKKMNYAVGRKTSNERIENFDAAIFLEMATNTCEQMDDVFYAWLLMFERFNFKLWKRGL